MKQRTGKYMVFGAVGLMVFTGLFMAPGYSEKVMADEADETGAAENEEDIFRTVLPTATEHVFDFIMDPQGLIRQTDAAAYGDLVFEDGATLFFRRSDGRCEEDYSSSSDALVIVNEGTVDAEIVLTAGIASDSLEGIVLTDDKAFTDDTEASLYLALSDGVHTVPIDPENGASLQTVLERKPEKDTAGCEYRFWLTGAVNENGDWSEVRDVVPKVTVIWSVTQGGASKQMPGQEENMTGIQKMEADEGPEKPGAVEDDTGQGTGQTSEAETDRKGREQDEIQVGEDRRGNEAPDGTENQDEDHLTGKDPGGQEEDGAGQADETEEKNGDSTEDDHFMTEDSTKNTETTTENKSIGHIGSPENGESKKSGGSPEDREGTENIGSPEDGEGTENSQSPTDRESMENIGSFKDRESTADSRSQDDGETKTEGEDPEE